MKKRRRAGIIRWAAVVLASLAGAYGAEFSEEPHRYWERKPADRFARLMEAVEAGTARLDGASDRALLSSLLRELEIDESTQLMVFSATSLQSGIVNPRNPRALYFNEDTYVGYIPGGRFEVASFDAETGMNFYISDRARVSGGAPDFTRSTRCMNCHADAQSRHLPGLVISSVGVTWDGSTQETYRYEEIGHHVPLRERFGGWHLTGGHGLGETHANKVGNLIPGGFKAEPNPPGRYFRLENYPRGSSDILPHLVMEHAAGFTNRVIEVIYRHREKPDDVAAQGKAADELARYLMFAGEAALPSGGIEGDADFVRDFRKRREGSAAAALREFDLRKRLFRAGVSYLIDSVVYRAIPGPVRAGVEERLREAAGGKSRWDDVTLTDAGKKALNAYFISAPTAR